MKQNPFDIENKRKILAKTKQYKNLKTTYSKHFPELIDNNNSNFWDRLNKDNNISSKNNPMAWDRIKTVKKLIPKSSLKILDVGFGAGQLEKNILPYNKKLKWYGIDISPESVKRVSNLYPEASFQVGNITKIKHKSNFFDYIICLEVLEHIKPIIIFKSLKEIHRVLKPKGIFIASVPLNENLEQMISIGNNPNAHLRSYSSSLIKAELEISGFTILKDFLLYAFNKNYKIKKFITMIIPKLRKPNNIILLSQKK